MLWLAALIPMLCGLLLAGWRPRRRTTLAAMALLALLAAAACLWNASVHAGAAQWRWSATLVLQAGLTPLSLTVAATVFCIAVPVLIYAALRESTSGLARLIGLLLAFTGAMELLVLAADLLTLLIGWELVGACSWALIAHEWREADNPRAGAVRVRRHAARRPGVCSSPRARPGPAAARSPLPI